MIEALKALFSVEIAAYIGLIAALFWLLRKHEHSGQANPKFEQSAGLLLAEMRQDMVEEGFQCVGTESEFADPSSQLVEVEDCLLVLIHAAGHFYALDDVCTHDGGPLSDGPLDVEQHTIACPRHGAQFDIRSGEAVTMPATKATVSHEVKVYGGQVFVKLT